MLTDGDAIRNLLGRYCDLVDRGDWPGVGELFASGRLAAEDGGVLASGADEVADFYRRGTRLHDGSPGTKHLVLNTVLSITDDRRSAEARSSYVVFQAVEGLVALQPIIAGRYVDTFVRDGEWRWDERRFAVDLVGDLSNHLGYTL